MAENLGNFYTVRYRGINHTYWLPQWGPFPYAGTSYPFDDLGGMKWLESQAAKEAWEAGGGAASPTPGPALPEAVGQPMNFASKETRRRIQERLNQSKRRRRNIQKFKQREKGALNPDTTSRKERARVLERKRRRRALTLGEVDFTPRPTQYNDIWNLGYVGKHAAGFQVHRVGSVSTGADEVLRDLGFDVSDSFIGMMDDEVGSTLSGSSYSVSSRLQSAITSNMEALRHFPSNLYTDLSDSLRDLITRQVDVYSDIEYRSMAALKQQVLSLRDRSQRLSVLYQSSGDKSLLSEIADLNKKIAALNSKIRGSQQSLFDAAAIHRRAYSRVGDGEYVMDYMSQGMKQRFDNLFESDPDLAMAVGRYQGEMRRIRSEAYAPRRILSQQKLVGGQALLNRGPMRGALVDVLEADGYTEDDVPGIRVRNRNVMPASLLGDVRHRVLESSTITRRLDAGDQNTLRFLNKLTGDQIADGAEAAASHFRQKGLDIMMGDISIHMDQLFEDARASLGLDYASSSKAMEEARSILLGTVYDAPKKVNRLTSTDGKTEAQIARELEEANWFRSSPEGTTRSFKNHLKSILARTDDEAQAIQDILFRISPDLKNYVWVTPSRARKVSDLVDILSSTMTHAGLPGDQQSLILAVKDSMRSELKANADDIKTNQLIDGMGTAGAESNIDDLLDSLDARDWVGLNDDIEALGSVVQRHSDTKSIISMVADMVDEEEESAQVVKLARNFTQDDLMRVFADYPVEQLMKKFDLSREEARAYLRVGTYVKQAIGDEDLYGQITSRARKTFRDARLDYQVAKSVEERVLRETLTYFFPEASDVINMTDTDPELMLGRSKEEVYDRLLSLKRDRARISLSIGEGMTSEFIIHDITKAADVDDVSSIQIKYALSGDEATRQMTLVNMGIDVDEARELARKSPFVTQSYSFSPLVEGLDSFNTSATDGFGQVYDAASQKYFLQIRREIYDKVDASDEALENFVKSFTGEHDNELLRSLRSMKRMGRFTAVDNAEFMIDAINEGNLSVVGRNTVTSDRHKFGSALAQHFANLSNGQAGVSGRGFRSKSLFRVTTDADGVERIAFNQAFHPLAVLEGGGVRRVTMSGAGASVLDEIVSGLGGVDEVKNLINMSSMTPVSDLPNTLLDDVFGDVGPGQSLIRPAHRVYGPLSFGNIVETVHEIDRTINEIEYGPDGSPVKKQVGDLIEDLKTSMGSDDILDGLPTTHTSTMSLGEHVAVAVNMAERGDDPGRVSAYVRSHIVDPVVAHKKNLLNENMLDFYSDEQASAMGVGRTTQEVVEAASEKGAGTTRKGMEHLNIKNLKSLFKKNRSVKYGAMGVAGLAVWGTFRNRRFKKDHTEEDVIGPSYLPGGSAYENSPQGFTNDYEGQMRESTPGMTYYVDASGSFDPNAMASEMGGYVSGSTRMTIHNRQDIISQRRQRFNDIISNY